MTVVKQDLATKHISEKEVIKTKEGSVNFILCALERT